MNISKKRLLVSTVVCMTLTLSVASWADGPSASDSAASTATANANAATDKANKAAADAAAATEQLKKTLDAITYPDQGTHRAPVEPTLPSVGNWTLWSVGLFFLAAVILTMAKLRNAKDWHLSDALSEKTDLGASIIAANAADNAMAAAASAALSANSAAASAANTLKAPQPQMQPAPPLAPVPAPPLTPPSTPAMVASTSRLIAFMGMLAMLSVFMGFGLYMLWALFTGDITKLDDNVKSAGTFLLYGAALYAPYAFNQIKEAMKG